LLAVLASCAAAPPQAPAAAAPPPCPCVCPKAAEALSAPAAAPGPTAATTATKNYHAAERNIAPAVTAGTATAAYIKAVDKADRLAREALRQLVAQDGHPTPDAVAGARRSLDDLVHTLETPQ
jgi:hypothetical protein